MTGAKTTPQATDGTPTDLKSQLDHLAEKMLNDAQKDGVKLSERMDVFKTISAYHLGLEKVKGKKGDDDDRGGPTMDSLRNSANGETDDE